MAENRAASSLANQQPSENGDMTGNDPIEGTRHVMQEEMIAAGNGVFAKNAGTAPANKSRAAAPEEGAPVSSESAPISAAPRKSAKRK
jgi:hypothetical protein